VLAPCVVWGLSYLAYFAIGERTVVDDSALLWTFRVLVLGGGAIAALALLVAPAVVIARVFRRAWREMGLPPASRS
jgi:hypothetical protein